MVNCNGTPILVITNLKLTKELDEKALDATLFKQIVGSLKYLHNSRLVINYMELD